MVIFYDRPDENEDEEENPMTYIDGIWNQKNEVKGTGWVSETGRRFKSVAVIKEILPPAVYRFVNTDTGLFFETQQFPTDDVISLQGIPSDYILNQIKLFWEKESEYKKYGLTHKRGILLYGEPGCGKTSIIRILCNEIIKKNGVVFSVDDFEDAIKFVSNFRATEPDRPILTIQEDVEGLFDGSEGADQVKAALSFLDGQDQTNNIIHIATTNQPEKLGDRFIKRPGRFDLIIGLHSPTAETREAYLRHVGKGQIQEDKLKELVQKTEGLGLSYLRELMSTYLCLGIPLDETLERVRMNSKTKIFTNKDAKLGFTIGYDSEKAAE